MNCMRCGRVLSADEVGLHKKLIHRDAKEFLCITCLGAYFSCSEELLRRKIAQFRAAGCRLFEPKKD